MTEQKRIRRTKEQRLAELQAEVAFAATKKRLILRLQSALQGAKRAKMPSELAGCQACMTAAQGIVDSLGSAP